MSNLRNPVSLRAIQQTSISGPVPSFGMHTAMLAAACLSSVVALDCALAQSQSSTNSHLPALTVEAPAVVTRKPRVRQRSARKRRPVRTRRANVRRGRPVAARRAAEASAMPVPLGTDSGGPGAGGPGAAGGEPNANPNANPAAPYKIERSASTKLTEPLINTPRSVTAVPKEVIADKGTTSFRDLVRTMPGMTLGTGEGGNAFGDRVFIRGFDARNDVYVNGVRDPGVPIRETFLYEQVEVLKGPGGVIGGRGTTGGAVNLVTKMPAFVNFHNAEVTFGNADTKRVTFDVNRKLSDTIAIRATGMWQDAKVPGRDFIYDKRWGGLFAVTWKPVEWFKVTMDYQHLNLDQLPDWGVPFDARTRRPFTESGLRRSNYYGIPSRDFQKSTQDIATLRLEYRFASWLTFENKLRYGKTIMDYVVGVPGSPDTSAANPANWTVTSSAKSRYQRNEIIANQANFTAKFGTFGLMHTLVAGVELSRENIYRDTYRGLDTENFQTTNIPGITVNLWNPNTGAIPWNTPLVLSGNATTLKVNTASFYLLDTINWRDRLFVTAGLRFDDYRINAASGGTVLSRHDGLWNFNLGVTYKILPFWAVYAAYGTSSNPVGSEVDGGGNDYGGLTAQNAVLGPEKNTAIEAGTKVELFNKRLLVTAAVFQTTKDNAREGQGRGAAATVSADGAYRVRGVEFGISGKITDRWSIFGGAVFLDSEVTRSMNPANVGQKLANIAHTSFNLLSKYDVTNKLTIGGQATWKGKVLGGTLAAVRQNDGRYNTLPGRWRFDAFAEYRFTKNVVGKIMVQNITNAVIYDAFYRSGTPYVNMAPGRTIAGSLKFKF
ncbi:MAG: TonB-dependent siderophore receptor [Hyphomicrobiales bacterium]|nr:TonB-dependent siderophore receptor [Hyphomicrobiales bacterium]